MLSVNDIIRECKLDLPRFGIQLEEVFIAHGSQSEERRCRLLPPPPPPLSASNEATGGAAKKRRVTPMKVVPSSCFIAAHQLPECMATSKEGHCSVAMATSNGHTVCMVYYWDEEGDKKVGRYALIDPFPGVAHLGLDGIGMVEKLSHALSLFLTDEGQDEQQDDRVRNPIMAKRRRKMGYFRSEHQHCDVTLMYQMLQQ